MTGYPQQVEKYIKATESILNHIQGIFDEVNYVKEALEELNHYEFIVLKQTSTVTIP